jgi:hypothetical protein
MEPHVYVWSWSGELLEAMPLAEFAINHDIDQRRLLAELLLVQAVTSREPQPLVFDPSDGTGNMLLTLTHRLWPVPLH